MSVAFFGIVRSKPKPEARLEAARRAADFSEVWSRRLERLSELVEAGGTECAYAETAR